MTPKALLQTYYEAFNRGDTEGMLACLADDVEHHVNQGGIRKGKDAFREFNAHMTRSYREHLEDVVLMVSEDGTRGAAEFTVVGEYLQTDEGLPPARGQTYRLPAGAFFAIRDDKITRVTTYYNLQDWIDQVSR